MAGYWAGAGSRENCDRNGGLDAKIGGDALSVHGSRLVSSKRETR